MQLCLNTFDGNWSKGIKSNVVGERQPRCQNEKTIPLKLIFGAALKAGLALGSASFLWLMGMYGYEANQAQTPRTLEGIRMCSGVYVGILFAVCTVLLIACKINKRMTIQMADELAGRRKKFTPVPNAGLTP
jgi:hypothetical protein